MGRMATTHLCFQGETRRSEGVVTFLGRNGQPVLPNCNNCAPSTSFFLETPFIDRFKLARRLFISDYAARDSEGKLVPGEVWDESTKAIQFQKFTDDLKPFVAKPKMTAKRILDNASWMADFCSRSTQVS